MTIRLYDSLARKKTALEPLRPGHVGIYVCGPTVYDDCHIGHLMGPVLFDAVACWLRARGYDVRFVNNITDEDVVSQKLISSFLLGSPTVSSYFPPRTWGVRLGLEW